jgi:ABC-type thiamine transport system substrate-binding protein
MGKDEGKTGGNTVTVAERPTQRMEPEADSLMGLNEFGATHIVNATLFAGFRQYCTNGKVPPRLTAKQWVTAMTNWQQAPVST